MNLKQGDILARRVNSTSYNFAQVINDGDYNLSDCYECFVFQLDGRPYRVVNDVSDGSRNNRHLKIYMEHGLSDLERKDLERILNHYFREIRVGLSIALLPMERQYNSDQYFTVRWLDVPAGDVDPNAGINGRYVEETKDIFIYKPIGPRKERFFTVLAHEILHILKLGDVELNGNIMNLSFVLNSIFISTTQLIHTADYPVTGALIYNHIELPSDDSLLDYNPENIENEA